MTTRLLMYLGVILIGALIGAKGKINEKLSSRLGDIQTIFLLLLLFIMGIKIGMDDTVVSSFFSIGFSAFVISIFTVSFSILGVFLIRGLLKVGVKND